MSVAGSETAPRKNGFGPAFCQESGLRARINGPNLALEPETAQSIAIALHELTTNAVKYGALSVPAGRLQVEWSRAENGQLVLRWSETDGPPVKPPARQGFGTRVVDQIIRAELKGEARYDWRPAGLVCEISMQA